MKPGSYDEFGDLATHLRYVERRSRKLARTTFYAMGRWQAKLEKKQAFLGRIVDIGAELFAISVGVRPTRTTIKAEQPERGESGLRARGPVLQAGPRRASTRCSASCGPTTTTPTTRRAQDVLDGPLHVGRGGRRRPVRRRADDRRPARAVRRRGELARGDRGRRRAGRRRGPVAASGRRPRAGRRPALVASLHEPVCLPLACVVLASLAVPSAAGAAPKPRPRRR